MRSARAALARSWTADGALLVLAPLFAIAVETPVVIASLAVISFGALIASAHRAIRRDDMATPLRLLPPVVDHVIDLDVVDAGAIDDRRAARPTPLALVYSADGT